MSPAQAHQAYYQTPSHAIAAGIAFPVADVLFVALRFWTRRKQRQVLRLDDWLLVPATLMTIVMGALIIYGVSEEAIAYRIQIPPDYTGSPLTLVTDQLAMASKVEYGVSVLLPLALGCIKMSFLCFYHRIFAVKIKTAVSWMLMSLTALMCLWSLAFFFSTLFECKLNFWAIWGTTMDLMTQCVETMTMIFAFCISDFVTDVIIIIIPIPLIWRLKLSKPKKFATSGVFLLGGVTVGASLTRLVVSAKAMANGFDPNGDEVLTITLYLYWGLVECGVGVLAACLPTVTFLFQFLSWESIRSKTKSIFSSQKSQNSSNDYSHPETMIKELHYTTSNSTGGDGGPIGGARGHSTDDSETGFVPSLMDDAESRGSNRINADPSNFDSYTTESSWRTRVPSEPGHDHLHPPPVAHHMKDFRSSIAQAQQLQRTPEE